MMNGRGKSDSAIVAERPTNQAGQPAAEPEERRAETEENAVQQSMRRAQNRESVRWIAYDKQQDRERRKSSPRSYTTSARNTSRRRSSSSRRMPHPEWMS